MSEIKEAKSLRWLAIQFPLVENPKDDIEKLQSCINLYCTAAAEKIEQLTEENERLHASCTELTRMQEENERLRAEGKWLSAYEYAIKLGETNQYRLGIAEHDKIWHFCSLCEQQVRSKRNFCPNCGAKMKGE